MPAPVPINGLGPTIITATTFTSAEPVSLELGPLLLILVLWVAGLAVTGWMDSQVVKAQRSKPVG